MANDASQLKSRYRARLYGLWSFVEPSLPRFRDILENLKQNDRPLDVPHDSYQAGCALQGRMFGSGGVLIEKEFGSDFALVLRQLPARRYDYFRMAEVILKSLNEVPGLARSLSLSMYTW